jgi:transposase
MGEEGFALRVGIDWGSEASQAWVMDAGGKRVWETCVKHEGAAIAGFLDELARLCDGHPERLAIGIEIPRGAIVEAAVERNFAVFSINPKQLDRFRDRHSIAGAKDDRRDAFVLSDSLRTDQHCFRRVRLDDPLIIQIRELSRADDELCHEVTRLSNRLRDQLHRFYPQPLAFSAAADEPWLWDLLEMAPTPQAGQRLRQQKLETLLQRARIRRFGACELLEKLQAAPLPLAPGVVEACSAHVVLLLPRLRLAHQQRKTCQTRIQKLLEQIGAEGDEAEKHEHRDVEILNSLPGVGVVVAATMLAEASQPLKERNYHALRAHTGVAPITRQSGKSARVTMRYACNHRLRNAVYHWARVSTQQDPQCLSHYSCLRQRGHSHGRALRAVADRLLRVLVAMLQNDTLYDPDRPRRPPRLAPVLHPL